VELMTSGAFAQASGLSRKALRLYDELGLLHPARVDPETLYRFYDPGQLEQARLVAWLRRLGIGLHREDNEDAAYAGARLLAVADGMGGHAAGEVASAAVIEALRPLDTQVPAGELLNALDYAVRRANSTLRDMVQANPALHGMGTTLTALLWSGSQLGLVHIGDSRAYLVRDGEVFQITQDHTVVQSLLDEGKITAEEVASHPQRLLLLRALTGDHASRPDLQLRQARAGDRYLLCSDGLHVVVPADAITRVLLTVTDPDQAAADLIALAMDGGAPDNITCIVAEVEQRTAQPASAGRQE
jgi:protein phosphatase